MAAVVVIELAAFHEEPQRFVNRVPAGNGEGRLTQADPAFIVYVGCRQMIQRCLWRFGLLLDGEDEIFPPAAQEDHARHRQAVAPVAGDRPPLAGRDVDGDEFLAGHLAPEEAVMGQQPR